MRHFEQLSNSEAAQGAWSFAASSQHAELAGDAAAARAAFGRGEFKVIDDSATSERDARLAELLDELTESCATAGKRGSMKSRHASRLG